MFMKFIIRKNNLLIRTRQSFLTLSETRFLALAIGQIHFNANITTTDYFDVDIDMFAGEFNIQRSHAYRTFKDLAVAISDKGFWIEDYKNDFEQIYTRFFCEVAVSDTREKIKVRFSPGIIKYISKLRDNFTVYLLDNVRELKNSYSFRIYELCKSQLNAHNKLKFGKLEVSIEELKEQLDMQDGYELYGNIKKVLNKSLLEINTFTDINIILYENKVGKKVISLTFVVTWKNEN